MEWRFSSALRVSWWLLPVERNKRSLRERLRSWTPLIYEISEVPKQR